LKKIFLLILTTLYLIGCGSSSPDDKEPSLPPPPSEIRQLVLNGKVTDELSSGSINISYGTTLHTTQIRSDNSFSISFNYEATNENINSWVKLQALGDVKTNQHIELFSHLNTLGELSKFAGEDNIINSSEFKELNLTQLSTVEYLITSEINNNIKNKQQLDSAKQKLVIDDLSLYGAFIQLLIEDNQYSINEGLTTVSILQIEESLNASYKLYNSLIPIDYNDQLKANNTVFTNYLDRINLIQDDLYGINLLTPDTYKDKVAYGGNSFTLNTDNTSESSSTDTYSDIWNLASLGNWKIENNLITLTIPEETSNPSFEDSYYSYNEIIEYWGQETLDKIQRLNPDFDIHSSSWLVINSPIESSYQQVSSNSKPIVSQKIVHKSELDVVSMNLTWEGLLPSYNKVTTELLTWYQPKSIASVFPQDVTGEWFMPTSQSVNLLYPEPGGISQNVKAITSIKILDNLTFTTPKGKSGNWEIIEGHKLRLNFSEGYSITYMPFSENEGLMSSHIDYTNSSGTHSVISWIAKAGTTFGLEKALLTPLPYFLNIGINNWRASDWNNDQLTFESVFGYQGYSGGDFHRISASSDDYINYDNGYFNAEKGWSWKEKSEKVISWQKIYSWGSRYREWHIVSQLDNESYIVTEFEYREEDSNGDGHYNKKGIAIPTRLNILRKTNLEDWPEEYQRSLDKGSLDY